MHLRILLVFSVRLRTFFLIEYHYESKGIGGHENCRVVLQTSDFSKIPNNIHDLEQFDIDIEIRLSKVSIPSRFLGNYVRWRIGGFSYTKSKPYKMKEWLDRVRRNVKTEHQSE
jgi:hypothetical protein